MPLSAGTRLGPFEILAPLGEGGMGEVYRASDTRLNRSVALKVLPDAFALDPDRVARFDREAQAVAALNHPNVATLFGVEDLGGRKALVLELVEGPTLAERFAGGSIPRDEAIAIARQIADALEAAHEQGIVHRDLKPANVKLRPDGVVKVLDFGLARLVDGGGVVGHDPTLSPTITSPAMTGMGVILGTAAYMSPEQAAGKQADKRADIWSFGVVLWELLSGERLFADESTSYVLADVLRSPITFERIPAGPLRELVQRCLDRDVKTRLRDIGEARIALSRPLTGVVAAAPAVASRRAPIAWAAAVAVLAVAIGVTEWAPWRAEPQRPLVRLPVDLGADVALPITAATDNVVVSPDGSRLLYVASAGSASSRIYIRRFDSDNATELPGTDGAHAAAFSPDSKSVVFLAGNLVYRISTDGGAPLRLAETDSNTHITWGDGDTIVVSGWSGLRRIPPGGGTAVKLTETDGNTIHAQAHVLPGGKTVTFLVGGVGLDTTTIEAMSLNGGDRKAVVNNAGTHRYLASGHLLYLREGTLFAVRFDPAELRTSGDAVPMITDVKTNMQGQVAAGTFSMTTDGTLVYRKATGAPLSIVGSAPQLATVQWIDASGQRTPLVRRPGNYVQPRLSPDGNHLLLTDYGSIAKGGVADVVVYDQRRETMTPLTVDGYGAGAVWVPPDGRFVVFVKSGGPGRSGDPLGELVWTNATGGQPQRLLSGAERFTSFISFSRDGTRVAYTANTGGRRGRGGRPPRSISTTAVTREGGQLKAGPPELFSPPGVDEFQPEFSPDGRWIAFATTRSEQPEVWVRALPAPSSSGAREQPYQIQISNSGGQNPRWYGSDELLYQAGDQIMSVRYIVEGGRLTIREKPRVRIDKVGHTQWDVAPDGRIAVVTPVEASKAPPTDHTVMLVQNFADEVRRRVK